LLLHNRLSFDSDKTVFNQDRGVKSTTNSDEIRDPFIRSIKSLEALETYAMNLDDFQLRGMVKVVREYAHAFFRMLSITLWTTPHAESKPALHTRLRPAYYPPV
jgi:hypothetical protein